MSPGRFPPFAKRVFMKRSAYYFDADELDSALDVLNEAIKNHRNWFDRLQTSLLCGASFDMDILDEAAHLHCRFGQWYYGNADDGIKAFMEFRELEQVHQHMHDKARALAKISIKAQPIDPNEYGLFLSNQHYLIDLLIQLREKVIDHRYSLDSLTGAVNRRSISLLLEQEFEQAKRYGKVYAVAMFDMDHFKQVNDTYGHIAGDQVLKQVTQFLQKSLRKSDRVGRYGGEEFLIMLPETSEQQAYHVMELCRDDLASQELVCGDNTISITVSIGVSQIDAEDEDAWLAVKRADVALYRAKTAGRNRVFMSND